MTNHYDVIGLGTVLIDHQVVLKRFPTPDTKVEVVTHHQQVGGPVPTALAMLRRLGRRCSFIGKWASDDGGHYIAQDLSREQIHTNHSITADGSTGFAQVWVDATTGSRTVAAWRGDFPPIQTAELPTPFPRCQFLHLDGWSGEAAIDAASQVKTQDARVFLDTGAPKPHMEKLIPWVDVLSCPERFLRQFPPTATYSDVRSAAACLQEMGPSTVIVTQGDRGAGCLTADGNWLEQAAFPIESVDTTGAGDVFCGALVHGLIENWHLERTLRFAAATAAIKCTALGNRSSLPSRDRIEAKIDS